MTAPKPDPLLPPGEVAALFGVDVQTVTRWANADRLTPIRTPGGHRRYREPEVRALLAERSLGMDLGADAEIEL